MRVVLDSNVIIAAFATQGLCHSLFEICVTRHTLILSSELLDEIDEKLRRKIKIPPKVVHEIIHYLKKNALLETPEILPREICRDPDDVNVLGLAVASRSECLVSGDGDLLVLGNFQGIPIFSPRDFYQRLLHEKPKA